ncbi:MAG: hemolysin III family protein [Tenericutes bacterium]|nr:hemolysin III family protein [Mycoplasmatota bacterium]
MNRIKLKDRKLPNYSKGEEIANMTSHIVGAVVGLIALVLCIIFAVKNKNLYGIVGGSIFGASMILLYTISSIYHGLSPKLTAKKVFQVLDHCTIFLLIAGTYTPIILCTIREYSSIMGWSLFAIVWILAIIGIILNAIDLKKYKVFSMICYLGMGWCILPLFGKLSLMLDKGAITLLLLGGIAYTIGAVLYIIGSKKKYYHTIFHIFVNIGSLLHFLCILIYVL